MARIAVVGAGPVGLATADQLAQAGHGVLVVAPASSATAGDPPLPIRQTHHAALAFWTPFSSGLTAAEEARQSQQTLAFYRGLDPHDESTGVAWRTVEHYWPEGACRTPAWVQAAGLNYCPLPHGGEYEGRPEVAFRWRCEYAYQAPVIDVDRFCRWYRMRLGEHTAIDFCDNWPYPLVGGADPSASDEADQAWVELLADQKIGAVVLCTGAGTVYHRLCDDEQAPPGRVAFKKGVVARVAATVDPSERALLYHGGMFDREALCLVPHQSGYVVGGTVDPAPAHNAEADWQVHDEEKAGIRRRAETFLPAACQVQLEEADFWAPDPNPGVEWRAGVRPMLANSGPVVGPARQMTGRFSRALGRPTPVVAHFGHGGSGFTLSQDTAARAVQQVAAALEKTLLTR